mmetsp:Transcript_64707/g.76618  ORF Transcript_64707/g.76618 Transcript_64707/m.76618 type:complete len:416 (+) Transcript_64707:592-1839(+)
MLTLGFGKIKVINAAIAESTSLPFACCLDEILGTDDGGIDAIGWDWSANEAAAGATEGFEAFVRRMGVLNGRPMLIVKDDYKLGSSRRELLRRLVRESDGGGGAVVPRDTMVVHTDPATRPFFQNVCQEDLTPGLMDWGEYGTPANAREKARRNPTVREHELIAWVVVMHFLSALELIAAGEVEERSGKEMEDDVRDCLLPPPVTLSATSAMSPSLQSLLYGSPTEDGGYRFPPLKCQTSFTPLLSSSKNKLSRVILSGTSDADDIDILLPWGPMYYHQGWVYGLSERDRNSHQNINRFGHLGFKDMRRAYFGVGASGPLTLFLPVAMHNDTTAVTGHVPVAAVDYITSVTLCGVDGVKAEKGCHVERDLNVTVGGISNVTVEAMAIDAAMVGNTKLCLFVRICGEIAILMSKQI